MAWVMTKPLGVLRLWRPMTFYSVEGANKRQVESASGFQGEALAWLRSCKYRYPLYIDNDRAMNLF